jgi:predicted Na+-dependent transporter
MNETLHIISQVSITTGVFSAMLAMGTSVPIGDVLHALHNRRMVTLALLANFVLVPLLALLLVRLLPMTADAQNALVLLGVAAGAPFLTRLTALSKGHRPFSIGLMVTLMAITVVYTPLVLPLLLPHISVSAFDIASSLSVVMLLPLVLGLIARGRYPELAEVSELLAHVARPCMALGMGAGVLAAWGDLVGTIGSWILIGTLLLALGGAAIGWFLGAGAPPGEQRVAALGTGMRNFSAGLLVAGRDLGPETLVMVSAGALVMMATTLVLAGELGRLLPGPPQPSKASA